QVPLSDHHQPAIGELAGRAWIRAGAREENHAGAPARTAPGHGLLHLRVERHGLRQSQTADRRVWLGQETSDFRAVRLKRPAALSCSSSQKPSQEFTATPAAPASSISLTVTHSSPIMGSL